MRLKDSQLNKRNHALPYSIIGVQCVLLGGVLFPPIYWQTACLLQRSGALDGKSADYNKIAKAVSSLSAQGVNIQPLNINHSQADFALDSESNIIYFGFSGVKGLKEQAIQEIFKARPFSSFFDFLGRTSVDVTSLVALLKAGAFDDFDDRQDLITTLARYKSDQKMQLNGQNLAMIERLGLWPQDTPELSLARRVFNFTQYLKLTPTAEIEAKGYSPAEFFQLDERAWGFLESIQWAQSEEGIALSKGIWKLAYDLYLKPIKQYLKDHQEEMVEKVNSKIVQEWRDKYFPQGETLAQWEIETTGLCFSKHPMAQIPNLADFNSLSQEPEIVNIFETKEGRRIPLYKLVTIAGVVIAKDKLHSTITLLTPTGPVDIKFRKQQFAAYDAQISKQVGGKKQVVEKSWLNRGVNLQIHGMRQDDQFVAKVYKKSPMQHTAYKILSIKPDNTFEVQKERKKGKVEESDE